jgi:excisionase family DNA binding protein
MNSCSTTLGAVKQSRTNRADRSGFKTSPERCNSKGSTKHHSLSELLNIDFDRLRDPDACATTSYPTAPAQPRLEAQFFDLETDQPDQPCEAIFATNAVVFPGPPFLSLNEAAEWLSISRSTIMRLTARGILATVTVSARRKISLSELENYAIARLAGVPVTTPFSSNKINEV